ncbi:heavy metal translocating P-type ATPase [Streptococcus sp. CSL10205-OR2]|uniref:heavy metal translocating P-type ATPase n=1 Tax=Streptococcus sp. CSL10205-OR2 TaxID=2980558 RepID=UPI0021D95B81|nr:heavy metal translocating P-type ATPase [Streptococcus sp. CSL10205-OR2]MCU9533777.1 heavy metal translocating P-type ATPase [Streptococcus sp. CSL10205-OR2]
MKVIHWLKKNPKMLKTLLCLGLIIIGFVVQSYLPIVGTLVLILAFIVGGYDSAKEGFLDLVENHHLNVDILMFLAAIGAGIIGYWLEGAILIFIFSLSNSLEELAMEKSKNAISALMSLTPDVARKITADGQIVEVATDSLKIGDAVQVRKGEAVPIDGTLTSDFALVDESMVTGEPISVEKYLNDSLIGGTINLDNQITMTVTVENKDTLFAKIVSLVEEAHENKSKTASFIEGLEDNYVKAVLLLVPIFILVSHFIFGWEWLDSFYRGMILLTVASPCALVASSTPATLSAISRAAQSGLIVKGGDIIDRMGDISVVVMDKTGTLTKGLPSVIHTEILSEEILVNQVVKTVEATSTHPISSALLEYTKTVEILSLDELEDVTGKGFKASYQGDVWRIGKKSFILEAIEELPKELAKTIAKEEKEGKTLVFVSRNQELMGYYSLFDEIKEESRLAISQLQGMGIKTIMLTGDNEKTAQHIASLLGIDHVIANCLPQDKTAAIKTLKEKHHGVAMVGDGINDAPALALADVSYAIGAGSDIAIESADSVIMDDLTRLPFSIALSRKMKTVIKENIIFALSVILILILANVFQLVTLPLGVVGHEGSTILVILNGLRLLRTTPFLATFKVKGYNVKKPEREFV